METEATGSQPSSSSASFKRPRPLLLVLIVVLVLAALVMKFWGSSGPTGPPSTAPRAAQERSGDAAKIDPAALDVKLEALSSERPGPGDTERNPFRFKPKPAPPPPPQSVTKPPPVSSQPPVPVGPPQPAAPPPITVKFIGTMELANGVTLAIFTDCTIGRKTRPYREGETILGQYRLVKIGLQSVVVEHLDGRGRTTLPKTGQECVK